jgi:hypothetical protein
MPNWCQNQLEITGPSNALKACLKAIRADKPDKDEEGKISALDFEKILPMPEELWKTVSPTRDDPKSQAIAKAMTKKYGAPDWYIWALNNWGTKWNVFATLEDEDKDYARIVFDSAWSPPEAIIQTLSGQHPELRFSLSYEESGMGIEGVKVYENGELIADVDREDKQTEAARQLGARAKKSPAKKKAKR